ncbi:DUF1343 domain-containing protein [Candidatus Sumerlaeota bacterium]|nr:DUF1343 domain-containing protein [Candidatus Sumerlaeota bacterium]
MASPRLGGLIVVFIILAAPTPKAFAAEVLPGVEVLIRSHVGELSGKRVGILTNPTGVDRELDSTIDLVRNLPGVKVVKLFAPEHGLRGGFYAGDKVDETRDPVSGLPIESLYGKSRRPTPEMLKDLDIVLYDIQDVGVRHYTFISSLVYMMEECEKAGVEVWVLDRPDPMGGALAGGPMMQEPFISFIGIHTIPKVYGMTPGEFAQMIHAERTPKLKLRVIPLEGWKRGMNYGDLGWTWVPPSQHIPHWESCYYYAMTGVIGELGKLNVGVGTPLPFEQLGMPGLDGAKLAAELNKVNLPGVRFRATSFTPKYGTLVDKECQGVQIHIADFRKVNPEQVSLAIMAALNKVAPEQKIFTAAVEKSGDPSMFMKALGDGTLGEALSKQTSLQSQTARMNEALKGFLARREKFLIYK